VLLAIHNPHADIIEIATTLEQFGAPLVMSPLQLYQALRGRGAEAPTRYWLAGTSHADPIVAEPEPHELATLRGRLEDAESLGYLNAVIAWRRSGDWRDAPVPRPIEEQYCSADVPLPRQGISFVDVGAFTGDTICSMLNHGFTFESILAIEPDPVNFNELVDTLHRTGVSAAAVSAAAGARVGMARFSAAATGSSALADSGSDLVPVLRLDDLLINQAVDYIKMDVEGSEFACLEGLADVIRTCAPTLAVSAYHKPEDLIDLPALLLDLCSGYRFFLRVYGQMSFDTVLYAVMPRDSQ